MPCGQWNHKFYTQGNKIFPNSYKETRKCFDNRGTRGTGRATIVLPMGTHITIEDALLYPDSKHTLLSYKDIRQNGFHIKTGDDNNEEFLLFTKHNGYSKQIV